MRGSSTGHMIKDMSHRLTRMLYDVVLDVLHSLDAILDALTCVLAGSKQSRSPAQALVLERLHNRKKKDARSTRSSPTKDESMNKRHNKTPTTTVSPILTRRRTALLASSGVGRLINDLTISCLREVLKRCRLHARSCLYMSYLMSYPQVSNGGLSWIEDMQSIPCGAKNLSLI